MLRGCLREADNAAVERGLLGQVEDTDTGLTYLNARYYDPELLRFLSPDPLMNPGDPRTLDPYRYGENNPVAFTDASALFAACSGLSGSAEQKCLTSYYKGTSSAAPTPGKATTTHKPPSRPRTVAPPSAPAAATPKISDQGFGEIWLGNMGLGGLGSQSLTTTLSTTANDFRCTASSALRNGNGYGSQWMNFLKRNPNQRGVLRTNAKFNGNMGLGVFDGVLALGTGADNYLIRYSEVENQADRIQLTVERTIVTEGTSALVGSVTDKYAATACASTGVGCLLIPASAAVQTVAGESVGSVYDWVMQGRVAAASGDEGRRRWGMASDLAAWGKDTWDS